MEIEALSDWPVAISPCRPLRASYGGPVGRKKSPTLEPGRSNSPRWQRIPPEIRNCVRGRTVDISSADEYQKKVVQALLPRLRTLVMGQGNNRYELARPLFQFFFKQLKQWVDIGPTLSAGDVIAHALEDTAVEYGIPKKPLVKGPIPVWPENVPISEAWRSIAELGMPHRGTVVFEDPGPGRELQVPSPAEYQHPRIGLTVTFNSNKDRLPKILIEIEGEPVCFLMKAMHPDEGRTVRKEARRIWESLVKELGVMFDVQQRREGRPIEFRLEKAAHLKYSGNLSWKQVAEKLCPEKHAHKKKCREMFRKGVAQFFKRLRSYALQLPPITG